MNPIRILLINVGLRRPLYPLATPPLGVLYLAAYLRERFPTDIRIINQRLNNDSAEDLAEAARKHEADVIGFSCLTTFAFTLPAIVQAVRAARPEALLVLGGPHASADGARALAHSGVDVVVKGEGESAFEQILQAWQEKKGFDGIPGLIWRDPSGETVVNPGEMPMIEDVDSLPMPAYDLIDLPAYWKHQSISPIPRRRYVSLTSSRGCPYGCMWCHKIFGRKMRAHSAERVVEEMARFTKTYGVDEVEFLDDTFNFSPKRVLDIADGMKAANLKLRLSFPPALRGDILTQDVVDALADAGTHLCALSLETGSPRLQKLMGKHLDIPKFLKAVEMVAKKNILIPGYCMMGFPTETEEELQMTIDIACASRFHTASFFTVTPFPGSPLYEFAQQNCPEKLAAFRYDSLDFSAMQGNLTDLPDSVLFAYQRKAMRKFYSRPSRIYHFLRAYPRPELLPVYVPIFLHRATKGLFSRIAK